MKIGIIGAGAAGMTAGLQAAWRGAAVTLFERNATIGRKLLVTGSGRCNLSNEGVAAHRYTCADSSWMEGLLDQFGVPHLLAMLAKIGILTTKTADGWYYPLSDSAHTVVDAFAAALHLTGVDLQLNQPVTSFLRSANGFIICWNKDAHPQEAFFDRVILAAGGKAYPTLGSRGELFPLLEKLGHTLIPKRPALAPLLVDLREFKAIQGVRLDVGARLWQETHLLAQSAGNLIFTEWGLNGPAAMDISHAVSAHPELKLNLSLNLLQYISTEFQQLLDRLRSTDLSIKVFLGAFFPPKVIAVILSMNRIEEGVAMKQLDSEKLARLSAWLQDIRFPINGVRGFEYCQISAGGVPVDEVDPRTMESQVVPGLYLVGETVDVVGPCGGYNLSYAFASGALAGMAAAE